MCDYLLVAVDRDHVDSFQEALPADLTARLSTGASINPPLPKQEVLLSVTDGCCSCLIFREAPGLGEEEELDSLRRKYAAKGWSSTKIERAIGQHRLTNRQFPWSGLRPDLAQAITEFSNRRNLSFLVHEFRGDHEEVLWGETRKMAPEDLTKPTCSLRRDVVYRMARDAHGS